jgi:hypothetical protein
MDRHRRCTVAFLLANATAVANPIPPFAPVIKTETFVKSLFKQSFDHRLRVFVFDIFRESIFGVLTVPVYAEGERAEVRGHLKTDRQTTRALKNTVFSISNDFIRSFSCPKSN